MRRAQLSPADWVSLSRLPLALIFLMAFEARPGPWLAACGAIGVVAQLSDHLDGYLARRRGPPPPTGWLFDSVADRAFHLAALLAYVREFGLEDTLVWLFVIREMCVYVLWIAKGDFEAVRPGFRLLGLIHAGIVRLAILAGCLLPYPWMPGLVRTEGAALLNGLTMLASIFGFYCLFLVLRAEPGPTATVDSGR